MKRLLAATIAVVLAAAAAADVPPVEPGRTLNVGDPAPTLKVSRWLQGEDANLFEPGRAYVIEFWATWCGPCIAILPELADLQSDYKDRGLTCVAVTVRDPDNSLEKAIGFVKRKGPKLPCRFAYTDDASMWDTWIKAAGKSVIPCAFVVDKTGCIAYVGNPVYLKIVAPLVVDGRMPAKAIAAEAARVAAEWATVSEVLGACFRTGGHRPGLRAVEQFEAKYPAIADNVIAIRAKLSCLALIGDMDRLKSVADGLINKAIRRNKPSMLAQVAGLLQNGPAKDRKDVLAVAVRASEAAVRLTEGDANTLIDLAEAYAIAGDIDRAKQVARKSLEVTAAEQAGADQNVERRARKLID
jgi:thiol-disulfide isomerase/thioredoxin